MTFLLPENNEKYGKAHKVRETLAMGLLFG